MKAAIAALLLLASPAMAQVYPGSTDTPLVTGPTFQQIPAGLIMVTPYGGQQMTLSEALAQGGGGGGGVTSVVGATGPAVTLGNLVAGGVASTAAVTSAISAATSGLSPLLSPQFTGTPTAPTQTAGDNDTSIATTAFVTAAVAAGGGGGGSTSTYSPTYIPKLPQVVLVNNGTNLNITHAYSGLIVVNADVVGNPHTWTLSLPATAGDDVCFYMANTSVVTFAAGTGTFLKSAPGVPTSMTAQYSRECAFFDGTNWVLYVG